VTGGPFSLVHRLSAYIPAALIMSRGVLWLISWRAYSMWTLANMGIANVKGEQFLSDSVQAAFRAPIRPLHQVLGCVHEIGV